MGLQTWLLGEILMQSISVHGNHSMSWREFSASHDVFVHITALGVVSCTGPLGLSKSFMGLVGPIV